MGFSREWKNIVYCNNTGIVFPPFPTNHQSFNLQAGEARFSYVAFAKSFPFTQLCCSSSCHAPPSFRKAEIGVYMDFKVLYKGYKDDGKTM